MSEYLVITAHSQFFVWPPRIKTLGQHPWPTNANTLPLGPAQMQALNQQTREQIARGFTSHHGKGQSPRRGFEHGRICGMCQRTIPR
jgi:hypothetical protein